MPNIITEPEKLYLIFDDASLITIIGRSGSGKSQLIFSYLDYLTKQYTPEEFQIRAYDVVMVDYWEEEPVMPWADVVHYPEASKKENILADIERVKGRVAGNDDVSQRVLVHINECDVFVNDFREEAIELCTLIAKHGKDINMQLIYETSRPTGAAMPRILVNMSGAKVMCPVANDIDAEYFMGEVSVYPKEQGEMLVKATKSAKLMNFKLYLPR